MNKTTCDVIDLTGIDEDTFSRMLTLFVVQRLSECSQDQFDDYYARGRSEGMSDREATENGLVMAIFNEMVIQSVTEVAQQLVKDAGDV